MGSSESTARTDGTTNREEEEEIRRQDSGGSSMGGGAAIAGAAVAGAAVAAAWGISRMLSDNTESQDNAMKYKPTAMEPSYSITPGTNNLGGSYSPKITNWSPPPYGRFKMNTDGACHPNQGPGGYVGNNQDDAVMRGPSGFAGILRDHRGEWVRGFQGYIGFSDCLTAEIYGIYHGLMLLDKYGYQDTVLESDSTGAINWIKQDSYRLRSEIIKDSWPIIEKCKSLVKKNRITVNYCSRDANKCADKLATMGIEKQQPYCEIKYPPNEIKLICEHESSIV